LFVFDLVDCCFVCGLFNSVVFASLIICMCLCLSVDSWLVLFDVVMMFVYLCFMRLLLVSFDCCLFGFDLVRFCFCEFDVFYVDLRGFFLFGCLLYCYNSVVAYWLLRVKYVYCGFVFGLNFGCLLCCYFIVDSLFHGLFICWCLCFSDLWCCFDVFVRCLLFSILWFVIPVVCLVVVYNSVVLPTITFLVVIIC